MVIAGQKRSESPADLEYAKPAAGAAPRHPAKPAAPVPRLTEKHDGQSFEIAVGDRLRIALRESQEPDVVWHIRITNETVVALQEASLARVQQPGRRSGLATRSWMFRGQAAGTADVRLRAVRSWKGRLVVVREFTVHLTVRDG